MARFQYVYPCEGIYPEIVDPVKGVLIANAGDVHEFDGDPPNDGRWVPAPRKRSPKEQDS